MHFFAKLLCMSKCAVIHVEKNENILDFVRRASADEQAGFWDCFAKTAAALGVAARLSAA